MEEQLEEGEIIDDDDDDDYNFEDISDNSIIDFPNTNGKFVSSNERLRALSLSSVSDTDITTINNYYNNKRHKKKSSLDKHIRKRHHRHHHHQHQQLFDTDDSSDTDIYYQDDDLKDKLKEAIRINGDDDDNIIKRSNLQTRLKLNFANCDNDQKQELCDDYELENLRLEALKTTEYNNKYDKQETNNNLSDRNDRIDDSELENLRLEALKTAVLNKFQKRKRRKALQENHIVDNDSQQNDNKENTTDKIVNNDINDESTIKKPCNEQNIENNQIMDLEDDEDLLRASLLANLAKKIKTTSEELELPVVHETKQIRLPQKIINNHNNNNKAIPLKSITKIPDPSKLVVNNLTKKDLPRRLIPIKPLIINLKDDSDSNDDDDDYGNFQQNNPVISDATKRPLDDLVEKFLKEQRAKVETQQLLKNQLIKSQLPTKQFQLQQQQQLQLQQIKKTKLIRNNNSSNLMEKSAMKLLPKSAQLEYQELLKRLKTAEIRQKILKRNNLNRVEKIETNCGKKVAELPSKIENSIENGAGINGTDTPDEVNKHLTTLQKTLKEIRIQKNGSLQMKSKYQDLTPIMKKIHEARNERKHYESLIKKILSDLKEAKNNLWKSHEKFSLHVNELIDKKAVIDKSLSNNINTKNVLINNNPIDKEIIVQKSNVDEMEAPLITSTPIRAINNIETIPMICNDKNDICEDMDLCTNDDEQEQQQSLHIDIVDPNDIDQIYRKRPIKTCIPEYISPLTNYERYNNVDPYGIMCPYEVNGSCRDSECSFKHFLKIQDNAR